MVLLVDSVPDRNSSTKHCDCQCLLCICSLVSSIQAFQITNFSCILQCYDYYHCTNEYCHVICILDISLRHRYSERFNFFLSLSKMCSIYFHSECSEQLCLTCMACGISYKIN